MADKELRLETKCYDAIEYGYLYGLNQKIPDEEFEKVKPYMKDFRRKDFADGIIKVTGRPEGYRCLEEDVPKVEEILNITNTLEKRRQKIEKAFNDPEEKRKLQDQSFTWLQTLFTRGGTKPKQDLSRLVVHSTKIYDPNNSYKDGKKDGKGSLFIYTPHGMWYIVNNSSEGSNKALNNVKTEDGGAIGYRLMYEDNVDMLIRIYTEENEYSGEKLY
ncbi:hypothetical protein [Methanosphaera sp.]